VTLTDPRVTGWVLLGLFLLATGLSLVFERRAFCNYLCPIGGFTGIYAQTAPVELRVIDKEVCAAHSKKSCYQSCPWGQYPVALRDSAACGLCMECLRACPKDNLAVSLRPFSADLAQPRPKARLDEAFLALVMLGSALAFAAVFVGPWGWLKAAAFQIGSLPWVGYTLGFLALNLLVLPGLFLLAIWMDLRLSGPRPSSGSKAALRRLAGVQAQALLPLGLMSWIAFTVSFALPKISTVLDVLSDPLGWGWNLLGTAGVNWSPDVSGFSPVLQAGLLVLGLFWSGEVARRLAQNDGAATRGALPVLGFCLVYTLAMLWLLIG